MPTRPSIMGGSLEGEIDIRPPETATREFSAVDVSQYALGPIGLGITVPARALFDDDYSTALGAAFRQENIVGSILSQPILGGTKDPEFDLLKRVEEEGELRNFDFFLTARNEDDFQLKLERLKREQADRKVLAESGFMGFETSMMAGIVDLPTLIPGATISTTAGRVANAARVAGAAGAVTAGTEAVLQGNQAERTTEESLFAIGGSVVLGGLIGSAVGRSVPDAMWKDLEKQVESLGIEMDEQFKSLSAAVNTDAKGGGGPFELRNEGRLQFLRKFPGGYLADIAEKYGKSGLAVVLEKFAPLAPLTRMDPLTRGQLQTSEAGRRLIADLAETVLQYRINEVGGVVSDGGSLETIVKHRIHAMMNEHLWAIRKAYAAHMKDGPVGTLGTLVAPFQGRYAHLRDSEKLTPKQFFEEVGTAMFSGDTHPVKGVEDLAQWLRGKILEPIRKELVDVGFFEDLPYKPKFGETYMTRRYKLEEIRKNEQNVMAALRKEFLATQEEARLRLRDAEAAEEAPEGSDAHIANMDEQDIDAAIEKTLANIKGLRPGESLLSVMNASPLKGRVLDVSDSVLLGLGILETDVGVLMESYIRSIVPRIEMQRKFGSLDLADRIAEVQAEYARLRADTKSAARIQQLENEEAARIADIRGVRDRILGVYDMPANPRDVWGRASRVARNLSYMQLLGMQVVSALPDITGLISRGGLGEFSRGVAELATNMPKFAKASREAAELLNAIEYVGNTRARALAELDTLHQNNSWAERAIEGGTGVFSNATGITAWNTLWKSVGNVIVMSKILKAADAVARGKATKKQLIALSENGIDRKMAIRMAKQFEKHGEKGNAIWFANASKWSDDEAFTLGQRAMSRETDIAIITPGQDKPLWFSTRLGAMFFQFKTFGVAANHRILLSGIQRGDADVMTQFAGLFALGAVVSNLRADLSGRPRKEGKDLLIDAIDRSGVFQIAFEANALAEIGGFGAAGLTGSQLPSRFQGRSKLLGSAGPNVDMIVTALEASRAALDDKPMKARDIDKIARLIPGQNSPYGMLFRNDIREGIAAVLGEDYEP